MMRIVGAVVVALAALSVSLAPAVSKPRPAHPKPAATAAARAAFAAMPETERNAIQYDLVWTGDYNGIVGVEFGDAPVMAIKAFQKRNGGKDTGILNPDERQKLAESARLKQERAGWRMVDDAATGARLGVPAKLVQPAPQVAGRGRQRAMMTASREIRRLSASRAHLLVNFAGRFSMKAAMPSFWSAVANSEWKALRSKRIPSASVVSKARLTASLASMRAGSDIDAMVSAVFSASSIRLASGTIRDTRPARSASAASIMRPLRQRSIAFALPTAWARRWVPPMPGMTPSLISG